jgi:plasmid stabilization system protein ParE
MSDYERIVAVDEDLKNIARYSFESWGIDQAKRYAAKLEKHFQGIAQGSVHTRAFLKHRPELRYTISTVRLVEWCWRSLIVARREKGT